MLVIDWKQNQSWFSVKWERNVHSKCFCIFAWFFLCFFFYIFQWMPIESIENTRETSQNTEENNLIPLMFATRPVERFNSFNIFQFPSKPLHLNQSALTNVSQTEMLFPAIDAVFYLIIRAVAVCRAVCLSRFSVLYKAKLSEWFAHIMWLLIASNMGNVKGTNKHRQRM